MEGLKQVATLTTFACSWAARRSVTTTASPGAVPRTEAMLAYVAVTRAKRTLERGGLAWIDDQLVGRAAARNRGNSDNAAKRLHNRI